MKFFSGFSLKNDAIFFNTFLSQSDFSVSGFSYGAIKAFEYVKESLKDGRRVDRLQLFSPAFFQSKDNKFKRLQTISFNKDREVYISQFINGCFSPYKVKEVEFIDSSLAELNELLYFEWSRDELQKIVNQGVIVEVYLGGNDKIIDVNRAREFFLDVATLTYIKDANHFLQFS